MSKIGKSKCTHTSKHMQDVAVKTHKGMSRGMLAKFNNRLRESTNAFAELVPCVLY